LPLFFICFWLDGEFPNPHPRTLFQ
jgi:hypothetical protein